MQKKEILRKISGDMERFLETHSHLEFYVLAFDCNTEYAGFLVSMNTQDDFSKTLETYRSEYKGYYDDDQNVNELRYNPGDWEYTDISEVTLFEEEELIAKYGVDLDAQCEDMMVLCEEILEDFRKTDVFKRISKTKDFVSFCMDHEESFEDAMERQASSPLLTEEIMKTIDSKAFPQISYEAGEEIWLDPDETIRPFYFDVTEDITGDEKGMEAVAAFLDALEDIQGQVIRAIKGIIADSTNEYHETIKYFLEFHRDELDPDVVENLTGVAHGKELTFEEWVDHLKLNRLGSYIDDNLNRQAFIMDWNFDPEISDELLVVYLCPNGEIFGISHES
jgi:hypothetical protein